MRWRGQENAIQASQADGLGTLNPIQPVSSWTADTVVEENTDAFWCFPATGNLSQKVLCLHALMCYGQLLPSAVLCHPQWCEVGREVNGCAAAWDRSSGNKNNFALSLAQCCEAAQDLMLTTVRVYFVGASKY